nr:MAG TPA: hypothetical protein [Caudoviricetes sp.]
MLHEVFCTFLYYRCQFFKNNFNWYYILKTL